MRAVNPDTGEVLELVNNQWVKVDAAPIQGQRSPSPQYLPPNRLSEAKRIGGQLARGDITEGEAYLQIAGEGAGLVADGFATATTALIPDSIEKWAGKQFKSFLTGTDVGKEFLQAAQQGGEAYSDWKDQNPRLAENLEAVGNITMMAPAAIPFKSIRSGMWLDKITPHPIAANLRNGRKWTKTKTGHLKYIPDAGDKEMANLLRTVPGLGQNPAMNNGRAHTFIQAEIGRVNEGLKAALAQNKRVLAPRTLKRKLAVAYQARNAKLPPSQRLTTEQIKKNIDDVVFYVNENGKNANGLLKARRELDANFTVAKANKAVDRLADGAQVSPGEIKWEVGRDVLNEALEGIAPGSKTQLRKMHKLIQADDIVWEKAWRNDERLWTQVKEGIGLGVNRVRFARGGG